MHWNYLVWKKRLKSLGIEVIEPKILKPKMKTPYIHKGKELTPLTPTTALGLDKGDFIKYIGPVPTTGYSSNLYGSFKRRAFCLIKRPTVTGNKITFDFTYSPWNNRKYTCKLEHVALAERGNPYDSDMRHAEKFVPINLKGFKRDISGLVDRTKTKIDRYLEKLPLHKKLELFKNLSPEDTLIYDCLYKDIEVLIGLKEPSSEEQTNGN